jgi:aryl-alcohol dehydrogenase-like predicted oxidoreductase
MNLSLGTAQFGMKYGINNSIGQISFNEATKIINLCKNHGVNFIDTAMNYGVSEEILGKIGVNDFKIITKFPSIPSKLNKKQKWIEEMVFNSLKILNVEKFYALLHHNGEELIKENNHEVLQSLIKLKSQGLIKKIGVSIYNPNQIHKLYKLFPFDIVQVPFNVIDQRLKEPEIISFIKTHNIEVQTRSIFLQGILFMNKDRLLKHFKPWKDIWELWFKYIEEKKLSPLEICLFFQKQLVDINLVTVGVDNAYHFKQIIDIVKNCQEIQLPNIKSNDLHLIDPRKWSV